MSDEIPPPASGDESATTVYPRVHRRVDATGDFGEVVLLLDFGPQAHGGHRFLVNGEPSFWDVEPGADPFSRGEWVELVDPPR